MRNYGTESMMTVSPLLLFWFVLLSGGCAMQDTAVRESQTGWILQSNQME